MDTLSALQKAHKEAAFSAVKLFLTLKHSDLNWTKLSYEPECGSINISCSDSSEIGEEPRSLKELFTDLLRPR